MNLYLVHCGFYDDEISDGIYEFHVNIPIAAATLEEANGKVRLESAFIKKKMHIDGIQAIESVSGYRIEVIPDHNKQTHIRSHQHRDL
jgi:hypothetical protein